MQDKDQIIAHLFSSFSEIRYAAIYSNNDLVCRQRQQVVNSSSADTDRYEELLVNPALLTLARQRGNIDCGGLRFLLVGYGHFYQLVKDIRGGHISICLEKSTDLAQVPERILACLTELCPELL